MLSISDGWFLYCSGLKRKGQIMKDARYCTYERARWGKCLKPAVASYTRRDWLSPGSVEHKNLCADHAHLSGEQYGWAKDD